MSGVVYLGIGAAALTLGLVQWLKDAFKLDGNVVNVLTVIVGTLITAWLYVLNEGLVSEPVQTISAIIITGVVGGLSAAGFYKLTPAHLNKGDE